MVELPLWAREVVALFGYPPADPDAVSAVVTRISERWQREFLPDVQAVIEAQAGTKTPEVLKRVLHITIWHALFGVGQVEAATEGTKRCAQIEAKAFDLLDELGTLLREHARLGWEGAEQNNPPNFGEMFDSLVRKEGHWAMATGVREALSAIRNTSQSAPTFIDLIESATALWKHDHSAYWPERGDHRTAFAHNMLDELNRFDCLTHRANATLINIASNTSEHTPESLKALMMRRRKAER
jgi:hypothetical protein